MLACSIPKLHFHYSLNNSADRGTIELFNNNSYIFRNNRKRDALGGFCVCVCCTKAEFQNAEFSPFTFIINPIKYIMHVSFNEN